MVSNEQIPFWDCEVQSSEYRDKVRYELCRAHIVCVCVCVCVRACVRVCVAVCVWGGRLQLWEAVVVTHCACVCVCARTHLGRLWEGAWLLRFAR